MSLLRPSRWFLSRATPYCLERSFRFSVWSFSKCRIISWTCLQKRALNGTLEHEAGRCFSIASTGHFGLPRRFKGWQYAAANHGFHQRCAANAVLFTTLRQDWMWSNMLHCWLVVWNTNLMTFHSVGNFILPFDCHIFQRGRYTTNQLTTIDHTMVWLILVINH